ncbi:hypothetical protein OIU76_013165 [Salix suchowensis]|nr:hypothetical protein OIU76_013165 [Salix suchowensis]
MDVTLGSCFGMESFVFRF